MREVRSWQPPDDDRRQLEAHRARLAQLARDRPFDLPAQIEDLPLPPGAVMTALLCDSLGGSGASIVVQDEDSSIHEVVDWLTQALPAAGYTLTDSARIAGDEELFGHHWQVRFRGPAGVQGDLLVSTLPKALTAAYPWVDVQVRVGQAATRRPGG